MRYQKARLLEKKIINEAYFTLRLSLGVPFESVTPGQFVMVKNLDMPSGGFLPRPFGIYRTETDGAGRITAIELLIKVVGGGTHALSQAEAGSRFSLLGPLGNGFAIPAHCSEVVAVAGGIGIVPFLMLGTEQREERSFSLLYGGKSARDRDILADFEEEGFEMGLASEDGSFGKKGLATDLLDETLKATGENPPQIVACGPEAMLKVVAFEANRLGRPCQLSLESRMACGIGTCHGCVVPVKDDSGGVTYKRVCKDGPVFDAHSFHWEQ
jgi:dihydroorotate dehydrogenase electron transfer subunit